MICNDAGLSVLAEWQLLPARFPNIELDEFVIMPNHVHAIIWLLDPKTVGAGLAPPGSTSLTAVVGAFKSRSTRAVNAATRRSGPLWQRGYYERVIRHDAELVKFRRYIAENPARWSAEDNPAAVR